MVKDIPGLIEKISKDLRTSTDIGVVGLSGGVDSLVTACLLVKALGSENVITIHMPYGTVDNNTENKFNNNSIKISDKLGTKSRFTPITEIADAICNATSWGPEGVEVISHLNKGNARARARMCVLYSTSHHLEMVTNKRVRVIGTGNLSEDFIGYDTKFGDSAWDICLIGDLFKSEVYQLAEHFVKEGLIESEMIDYLPSAGLWENQTDEKEIGYSYNQMEPSVRKLLDNLTTSDKNEIDNFVLKKHLDNKHKHEAPPKLNIREFCE